MSLSGATRVDVATGRRDAYIDLLRVASIGGIVFGHWFSAVAWRHDGRIGVDSILADIPALSPASWLLMTVPVLLFAGGYANAEVITRSGRTGGWVGRFLLRRVRRLLAPTAAFLAVWAGVVVLLHVMDLGGTHLVRGVSVRGVLPFGPLWFMAIYLALVLLSPLTFALHERYRLAVPAGLVAAAVAVDVLRFVAHVPYVGWLNLVLAWLLPFQLGYAYATGPLDGRSRRLPAILCLAGLAGLVLFTGTGAYPVSIGGVPGEPFSNMRPPSLVIVALALWQVGLVLLAAGWARRITRHPPVATAVAALNRAAMSMYLWHMTALLVVLVILEPFGLSRERPSLAEWWIQRPIWLALGVAVLAAIVRVIARVERFR